MEQVMHRNIEHLRRNHYLSLFANRSFWATPYHGFLGKAGSFLGLIFQLFSRKCIFLILFSSCWWLRHITGCRLVPCFFARNDFSSLTWNPNLCYEICLFSIQSLVLHSVHKVPFQSWTICRYSMARRFVDDKVPVVTSATVHAFLQRNDFINLIHENQVRELWYFLSKNLIFRKPNSSTIPHPFSSTSCIEFGVEESRLKSNKFLKFTFTK